MKHLINARRDKKLLCFQLVIPVMFVIFGLLLLKIPNKFDQPALTLDASTFNMAFDEPEQRNRVPLNGSHLESSTNVSFSPTKGTCSAY